MDTSRTIPQRAGRPPRRAVGTIVIGGGQAGLATSRLLTDAGEEHLVLEAGRVGHRWTTERWSSLRLITPNWMTGLPGYGYPGQDPDGFMTAPEVARLLEGYRDTFTPPILECTPVLSVEPLAEGFAVTSEGGAWRARDVVVATGATGVPDVPRAASVGLHPSVTQLHLRDYRGPDRLPEGAVLVVGASASGLAAAAELLRAGREVVLSVGRHTWLPRRLDGHDVWWWLRRAGWTAQTIAEVDDPTAARREPRLQLLGGRAHRGLAELVAAGATVVGRVRGADGHRVWLADDLEATLRGARESTSRLLALLAAAGADTRGCGYPEWDRPPAPEHLDLRGRGVSTVLWATGYRPSYPWLQVPVLGPDGHIRQRRGAAAHPGLWVVGARFQHRRDSVFLDGVGHGARDVVRGLRRRARGGRRPGLAA
jgi:putative flavoprotein involved in K+ transport